MSVDEFRLNTDIWVAAEIRRCETLFLNPVILHKGDLERGLVIMKIYVHGQGCKIYSQSRDFDGKLNWHQPLGEQWFAEGQADQYITRQRNFDEDLWVIEIDDVKNIYAPLD